MNGALERSRLALGRHLLLLHRLEQRSLRLRRGAVDLVGEEEVGEDRARQERELGAALVEDRGARHVGGHQVGRELDARELERSSPARTSARSASSRGRGSPRAARARRRAPRRGSARAPSRLPTIARSTSSSTAPPRSRTSCSSIRAAPAWSTTARTRRIGRPGALRSAGSGRSGRSSSHDSSPSAARARSGWRSKSMPSRADAASRSSGSRRVCRCPALVVPSVISRSMRTSSDGRVGSGAFRDSTCSNSEPRVPPRLRSEDRGRSVEADRGEREHVAGRDPRRRDRDAGRARR